MLDATRIRKHTHLNAAGKLLKMPNAIEERSRELFRDLPEAIRTRRAWPSGSYFAGAVMNFEHPVPAGHSMDSFLRTIVWFGAQQRYAAISDRVKRQIMLSAIIKLGFQYFLIRDIVNFVANTTSVQGRGSAANSAVCYCLGITPVDPVENHLVFERFLNESRKGWPDIDLDLPSGDRRESVIQEIYRRYGRHGAAMTANVISYRGRSAAREIGKALNFSPSIIERFSHLFASGDFPHTMELQSQIEQAGLPKNHPRMAAFVRLYHAIYGLPRHLGQHSGGLIICQNKLSSFVPLRALHAWSGRRTMGQRRLRRPRDRSRSAGARHDVGHAGRAKALSNEGTTSDLAHSKVVRNFQIMRGRYDRCVSNPKPRANGHRG